MPETEKIKEEDRYVYGTIIIDKDDLSMKVTMDSTLGACGLQICNHDCKNCLWIPCG